MADKESVFNILNKVNVNEHTEKKNGLTYLSWAWAWAEVKKRFQDANYTIYENAEGWNYFTDGKTCWVKTGVTIDGIEHIEYLPVMDFRNKSIPTDSITSFDVNKAIQRGLTKACARHGLGLYVYAGEDVPEDGELEIAELKEKSIDERKSRTLKQMIEESKSDTKAILTYVNDKYKTKRKSVDEFNNEEWADVVKLIEQKLAKEK